MAAWVMSRAERLLDLIQILRRHRRPVSGRALADTAGVSLRTLYRDIRSLQAQGAAIDGEPSTRASISSSLNIRGGSMKPGRRI